MEELLSNWRKVQHQIASEVIVRPDADESKSDYKYAPLKVEQSALLNGGDEILLGGVGNISLQLMKEPYFSRFMPFPHRYAVDYVKFLDVSFGKNDSAIAVYVVTKGEEVVYQDHMMFTLTLPYVSSYLSFREIEPLTELIKKQLAGVPEVTPDVILVDGNGVLHERRAGIASFLGVRTNMRTIGVGKSLYCMDGLDKNVVLEGIESKVDKFLKESHKFEENAKVQSKQEVVVIDNSTIRPKKDGSSSTSRVPTNASATKNEQYTQNVKMMSKFCNGLAMPLQGKSGRVLAAAIVGHGGRIKGRDGAGGTKNPIYVSVGHDISLQESIEICAKCSFARIPEPVRRADLLGREMMRVEEAKSTCQNSS
jgi:deoxyinosine 3'endonuclease (endonuclease V)